MLSYRLTHSSIPSTQLHMMLLRSSTLRRAESVAGRFLHRSHLTPVALQLPAARLIATAAAAAHERQHSTGSRSMKGCVAAVVGVVAVVACAALVRSDSPVAAQGERRNAPTPRGLGDAMASAAAAGDLERLQLLVDRYKNRNGVNLAHRFGWTPLHAAAANGHKHVVEWLLSRPEIAVNSRDTYAPDLNDPFLRSVQFSARQQAFPDVNPEVPAFDPEQGQGSGYTPLHYASLFAPLEIVEMLLAAGADPELKAHGYAAGQIDLDRLPKDSPDKARLSQISTHLEAERQKRQTARERQEKEDRLRFPLEAKLSKEMIAQEVPILSVASAMRRRENGWSDPNKPLVFLFLGSSGVGKTMLAKELARHVLKDPDAFVRLDMSEFQQKHEMSRLIGSPPGYVGHETGGQLTAALTKHPNAVVLLDEIEKAHPDVLTLLLATFDEGRLTDGQGKTITCPQAVFVMTSNLVQEEIRDAIESGYMLRPPSTISVLSDVTRSSEALRQLGGVTSTPLQATEAEIAANKSDKPSSPPPADGSSSSGTPASSSALDAAPASTPADVSSVMSRVASDTERFLRFVVHPLLKRAFHRDEFIGRINEVVIFHPFDRHDLQQTVQMELQRWAQRAKERHSIELEFSPRLVDSLTNNYDERYGYRSIMFGVEKRVINVLAAAHERDKISAGCRVVLDIADDTGDKQATTGQQPSVVITSVSKLNNAAASDRKKFFGIF